MPADEPGDPTRVRTDPTLGLTPDEVAERVASGRTNDVPTRASRSAWDIVRSNLFTRINAIFAALFATRDRSIGMESFVENGPGKARFEGR